MKLLLVIAILAVVLASSSAWQLRRKPQWDTDWETFKGRHGKKYRDAAEEEVRRTNWEAAREKVDKHNAEVLEGKHTFTMDVNHLSDWTALEKKKLVSARYPQERPAATETVGAEERQLAPDTVDYRNTTCLNAVKDQGQCGSCWAFSATTALEFALCKKKSNTKVVLSEQQLVDCSDAFSNYACDGGWYVNAWKYVKAAPGQTSASTYAYTQLDGTCRYNSSSSSVGTATGYAYVQAKNETAIRLALANRGPVSASLDVVDSFYSYSSGVYSETNCSTDGSTVNHAVVLVGYGTTSTNIPYWVLRNSWGTGWGLNGYSLIRRGVNLCNIESWAAYPTV